MFSYALTVLVRLHCLQGRPGGDLFGSGGRELRRVLAAHERKCSCLRHGTRAVVSCYFECSRRGYALFIIPRHGSAAQKNSYKSFSTSMQGVASFVSYRSADGQVHRREIVGTSNGCFAASKCDSNRHQFGPLRIIPPGQQRQCRQQTIFFGLFRTRAPVMET